MGKNNNLIDFEFYLIYFSNKLSNTLSNKSFTKYQILFHGIIHYYCNYFMESIAPPKLFFLENF